MDGEGGWLLPGLIELHPTTSINSSPRARKSTGPPIRDEQPRRADGGKRHHHRTGRLAIGDVRDGGDRLENLEKMITPSKRRRNAASTAPSTACTWLRTAAPHHVAAV